MLYKSLLLREQFVHTISINIHLIRRINVKIVETGGTVCLLDSKFWKLARLPSEREISLES